MLLVTSLFSWWYTDGWKRRARLIADRLDSTIDYFSFGLLTRTLFAPFRQISAGSVDGPIGLQLRAMVDKLFSRLIGAVVRTMLLLVGCVAILLQVLLAVVILIGWALVPLLPLVGIGLAVAGWTLQ